MSEGLYHATLSQRSSRIERCSSTCPKTKKWNLIVIKRFMLLPGIYSLFSDVQLLLHWNGPEQPQVLEHQPQASSLSSVLLPSTLLLLLNWLVTVPMTFGDFDERWQTLHLFRPIDVPLLAGSGLAQPKSHLWY